jgi:hypothetical protein
VNSGIGALFRGGSVFFKKIIAKLAVCKSRLKARVIGGHGRSRLLERMVVNSGVSRRMERRPSILEVNRIMVTILSMPDY